MLPSVSGAASCSADQQALQEYMTAYLLTVIDYLNQLNNKQILFTSTLPHALQSCLSPGATALAFNVQPPHPPARSIGKAAPALRLSRFFVNKNENGHLVTERLVVLCVFCFKILEGLTVGLHNAAPSPGIRPLN